MQKIDGIQVWGEPLNDALGQMRNCMNEHVVCAALMADHHWGYGVPIGGVIAYRDKINPAGVGYDIGCGNRAIRLNMTYNTIEGQVSNIMDEIFSTLSFGVGLKNKKQIGSYIFDDDKWGLPVPSKLKHLAQEQLGTVGSGNHYVDLFVDEQAWLWIGVHFGSRGFGYKTAQHFYKTIGASDKKDIPPVLIGVNSTVGKEYIACMELAGLYAEIGRAHVCEIVKDIISPSAIVTDTISNHHNFAWEELHKINGVLENMWVVRKGATPCFRGQMCFVGGSMGDKSYILRGKDGTRTEETTAESEQALFSTIHGAGRVMSRNVAAGKTKWISGRKTKVAEGAISRTMLNDWIKPMGVELRGAGTDESPHCYKRIDEVLRSHINTVDIVHTLQPIGVAMAGDDDYDPYKD